MIEVTFDTVFAAYKQLPRPDQRRLRELLLSESEIAKSPSKKLSPVVPEIAGHDLSQLTNVRWADQTELSRAMGKLFANLGIQGEPISVEALQKLMAKEGLEPNELSRAIIAARDE